MGNRIRVLHLEDSPLDAEILRDRLRSEDLAAEVVLVASREAFEAALDADAFDLVVTDYNLPGYDGLSALQHARARRPETPVIVVSGTLGEEQAVECLHLGATDYVLKHRLERLGPAVSRALKEVEERRERRRVEARLRETEERLRQMVELSDQCFWFYRVDPPAVLYVSPAVEAMWGLPPEDFYRDPDLWLRAIHSDDRALAREQFEHSIQSRARAFLMRYRVVRPDGTVRWIEDSATVIDQPGQSLLVSSVARDVTKMMDLELQFRQAQKMESLGQLAGGIAHDFNNLLTVINGMTQLALEQLPPDAPLRKDLEEVACAGERAAALTGQLLAFSRKRVVEPRVIDLRVVVGEMQGMSRRLVGEDIEVSILAAPALSSVRVDPGQIEQVIVNLIVNARDAMPQGGRLTVELREVEVGERPPGPDGAVVAPGRYVLLAVNDTGIGMDEATRARIFEPFFTTKGPGKGTGLGLSTVFSIVSQSGGFVDVQSEVGRGTSFRVHLPAVAEAASESRPAVAAGSRRGGETILVAEDMDGLRRLATRMLESAGYTVLSAADSREALRLLAQDPRPVHLLLTDVVLPGLSGTALAEEARTLRPGLKVLYVSGYADDVVVRNGVLRAEAAFLGKPFTAGELTQKVREVLDSTG